MAHGIKQYRSNDKECFVSIFHDIAMTSITGEEVEFSGFAGSLRLIVNVASR